MPAGTVLFSSRAPVGYVAIAQGPVTTNQGFKSFVPSRALVPDFLYYYLQRARGLIEGLASGTTFKEISGAKARTIPIPVAPLAEQRRIAENLDAELSRLDAAVASLEAAERKLKAYRASVLKAAVEGRLVPTEAELAREEGRSYEPAHVLLERILTERRRRWEGAELAKMQAAGKTPTDDKWKTKYRQPQTSDIDGLPALPEGWCWASLDCVADVRGGITKGQKRRPGEALRNVPYLRVANVQRGHLDLTHVKAIAATPAEIDELRLQPGDVLFNEGGDRDKLGRGWVWSGEIPDCIHQNHVFRARLLGSLRSRFISWYANSGGQAYFFNQGKQTTNLASVNMTKLKALPIPIPPLEEQDRIIEEVERLLSVADTATAYVRTEVRRCQRLRQSILAWAFEGRLVDQDPADEPADALLARIRPRQGSGGHVRSERTAATAAKTRRRRSRTVEAHEASAS
jgi:type I restriction enzyme S subunit